MAIAEQPPRALYDYNQSWVVRNALRPNQPAPFRPQRGIDARRTPANPLADLGLFAAHPIVVDGAPVGAVVLVRVYNDGLMQELADLTGLDVAVLTADSLIAGSRDVRSPLPAPPGAPPGPAPGPGGAGAPDRGAAVRGRRRPRPELAHPALPGHPDAHPAGRLAGRGAPRPQRQPQPAPGGGHPLRGPGDGRHRRRPGAPARGHPAGSSWAGPLWPSSPPRPWRGPCSAPWRR